MFISQDLRNVTMIQYTNCRGRSQVFWHATLCHSLGEWLLMLRRTVLPWSSRDKQSQNKQQELLTQCRVTLSNSSV